jgi:hypothetical protein
MTKKSRTILIVSLVVAGAAIAVPITVVHYRKPNFAKMTPRQIREYFDSNELRDANGQARRQIREQIGEAMQARMTAQVNGYFALPEGEQRTAYLDNIIDEMETRRAEFMANRDPNRPFDPNRFGPPDANGRPRFGRQGENFGQRPRMDPERMRARSERMSADTRVKMTQFRRDLQKRMQQRGIQMPMFGPGGPGGGRGGMGPGRGFGPPG